MVVLLRGSDVPGVVAAVVAGVVVGVVAGIVVVLPPVGGATQDPLSMVDPLEQAVVASGVDVGNVDPPVGPFGPHFPSLTSSSSLQDGGVTTGTQTPFDLAEEGPQDEVVEPAGVVVGTQTPPERVSVVAQAAVVVVVMPPVGVLGTQTLFVVSTIEPSAQVVVVVVVEVIPPVGVLGTHTLLVESIVDPSPQIVVVVTPPVGTHLPVPSFDSVAAQAVVVVIEVRGTQTPLSIVLPSEHVDVVKGVVV